MSKMSGTAFRTLARASCISGLLVAGIAASAAESDPPKDPPPKPDPPALSVKCVFVRDHEIWNGLGLDKTARPGATSADAQLPKNNLDGTPGAAAPRTPACTEGAARNTLTTAGSLIGAGDIEIVVAADTYKSATEYELKHGGKMFPYVNGVALPKDAELIAIENRGTHTHLRYRINPGKESQTLWAMLYREGGLTVREPLRAALGWRGLGPTSTPQGTDEVATIAISNRLKTISASLVAILLIFLTYLIGSRSDALRDAALPQWWRDARGLRKALARADIATRNATIQARFPAYDPKQAAAYVAQADKALSGIVPASDQEDPALAGLVLRQRRWTPVRAAYSLARVQLALWFAFAVAAGLFLWIVYGELPPIDGSLLGLLGLSITTAGVSLAVDRNAGGRAYSPSRGFFSDLVTGFDDKQQIHRYQAVVVNLLLLFIGIAHVVQQLTYPIFDPTWLALLGGSGLALGAGKQLLEQPQATGAQPSAGPPAGGARPSDDGALG